MENSQMHKLYQELIREFYILKDMDAKKINKRTEGLFFFFSMLGAPFFLVGGVVFLGTRWSTFWTLTALMGIVVFFIICIYTIRHIITSKNNNVYEKIRSHHERLFASIYQKDTIDSVLIRTKEAQKLINLTKKVAKNKNISVEKLIEKEILFILYVLESLRKDIHGTPELNAISSIQQSRLDKQIEQFEELQRVLVKV